MIYIYMPAATRRLPFFLFCGVYPRPAAYLTRSKGEPLILGRSLAKKYPKSMISGARPFHRLTGSTPHMVQPTDAHRRPYPRASPWRSAKKRLVPRRRAGAESDQQEQPCRQRKPTGWERIRQGQGQRQRQEQNPKAEQRKGPWQWPEGWRQRSVARCNRWRKGQGQKTRETGFDRQVNCHLARLTAGLTVTDWAWLSKGEQLRQNLFVVEDGAASHPSPLELPWPVILTCGSYSMKHIFAPRRFCKSLLEDRLVDFGNRVKWATAFKLHPHLQNQTTHIIYIHIIEYKYIYNI